MPYIFSDLEGFSIEDTIRQIKLDNNNETNDNDNDIIIGNIIDSINTPIEEFFEKKTFNLQNIHYCAFNKKITLLLGNKDLNKLKLYKSLQINNTDPIFNNFNEGNVDIDRETYNRKFKDDISWMPIVAEPSQFSCTEAEKTASQQDIDNINKPSNFITRFNYIFTKIMESDSLLLYSIPYEIEKELRKKNNTTDMQIINLDRIKEIFLQRNTQSTDYSDELNYYAFIVLAIFRSLLINKKTDTINELDYTKNSSFCRNLLYNIYMQNNTLMVLLYYDKYLLSHNGITKHFIYFFSSTVIYFYDNIKASVNNKTRDNIIDKYDELDTTNLSHSRLKSIINICNRTVKKWIAYSYTDIIYLLCISYITSTNIEKKPLAGLYQHNRSEDDYFYPIRVGISSSSMRKELQYTSSEYPIIQIFGNRQFSFVNSTYKIDDKNMLICLYMAYLLNYIYINNNVLKSISKLEISKLTLTPYNGRIKNSNMTETTILYRDPGIANFDTSEICIENIIISNTDVINYKNYTDTHYILNQYSILEDIPELSDENLIQVIYNGILKHNEKDYYAFSIIKKNVKDFYILSDEKIMQYFKPFIESIINMIINILSIDEVTQIISDLEKNISDITLELDKIKDKTENNAYVTSDANNNTEINYVKSLKKELLENKKDIFEKKKNNSENILHKNEEYFKLIDITKNLLSIDEETQIKSDLEKNIDIIDLKLTNVEGETNNKSTNSSIKKMVMNYINDLKKRLLEYKKHILKKINSKNKNKVYIQSPNESIIPKYKLSNEYFKNVTKYKKCEKYNDNLYITTVNYIIKNIASNLKKETLKIIEKDGNDHRLFVLYSTYYTNL